MKRLPFLTPSQRRALLVLEWVLLLGLVGATMRKSGNTSGTKSADKVSPLTMQQNAGKYVSPDRQGKGSSSLPQEPQPASFPFDPNTADSTTLLRLGLSPWQVRSIYRFRAKHGRYHEAEDFMRLPGLTNEQWERLGPQIRIAQKFRYVEPKPRARFRQSAEPSLPSERNAKETAMQSDVSGRRDSFPRQEKLSPGETIDVNTADTSLLKMIPGIASKRAARIVAYRNALGGFVTAEQAMEATQMPDSVLRYMIVAPQPVRKINVNRLSVQRLMNHPYISFYQARDIVEHRRNKGELHNVEELSHLGSFRPSDVDRLRPYVEF